MESWSISFRLGRAGLVTLGSETVMSGTAIRIAGTLVEAAGSATLVGTTTVDDGATSDVSCRSVRSTLFRNQPEPGAAPSATVVRAGSTAIHAPDTLAVVAAPCSVGLVSYEFIVRTETRSLGFADSPCLGVGLQPRAWA